MGECVQVVLNLGECQLPCSMASIRLGHLQLAEIVAHGLLVCETMPNGWAVGLLRCAATPAQAMVWNARQTSPFQACMFAGAARIVQSFILAMLRMR